MRHSRIMLFSLFSFFCAGIHAQDKQVAIDPIFPIGSQISSSNFTGEPWVKRLFFADSSFNSSVGNVTFAPGTRSNWHKHPGGQILLALNGMGFYQEKGEDLRILRPGDAVKCPPNVEHWHGASNEDWFVQLAITASHEEGRVVWLGPVSQDEYEKGISRKAELESLKFLSNRHLHLVAISSFTAKGDLDKLAVSLSKALDDGLSVNEIKEA